MRVPTIVAGLLAVCPLLSAQSPLVASQIPENQAAEQIALEFQQLRLPGRGVNKAVAKLAKLDWKKSLPRAQVEARKTGKPIFLVQALGTLTGYT